MKLSRLEAMRMVRDQREAEVAQPLRYRITAQSVRIHDLENECDGLQSVVTSDVTPHLIALMREQISERVSRAIYEAMCKASGRDLAEIITVGLSANDVRFMRPDDVTEQIISRAAQTYQKETRAHVFIDRTASITRLRISLPSVHAEVAIEEDLLQKRRAAR